MPFAATDTARIYWRVEGADDRPALVLINSIGCELGMYDTLAPLLLKSFRLLRLDTRGHGASDVKSGDYTMELLAGDVLAAMDAAGIDRAAVCGVSLGGMIAMEAVLAAPARFSHLVAACTAAEVDPAAWDGRIKAIAAGGMAAVVDLAIGRFFAEGFRQEHPEVVDTFRRNLRIMAPDGYMGCAAAVRDMRLLPRLNAVAIPTLVIGGAKDISTPFAGNGDKIVAAIPGARSVVLDAAHLACVEDPAGFAQAVSHFLAA